MSGLRHAIEVLDDINGISFNFFQSKDVVRHPVVARIVDAYDNHDQKVNREKQEKKQAQKASHDVDSSEVS
jgi:phosphate starvation-inducible PhoH-like protein